jgi:oligopeptide/dipeptide ABC transporter ATP-binding protein
VLVILAIIGPLLWGGKAGVIDVNGLNEGATWAHPFGTDNLGRDLLDRTLVASRTSLTIAAVTTVLGFALGVLVGMLPVTLGARGGRAVGNVIGLLVAFPSILLVLLIVAIAGAGTRGMVIALAIAIAPASARFTQTLAAAAGRSEYVAAARVVGVGRARLLVRHILPNVSSPLVLQLAQTMSAALLASSALSFLGIGVQDPSYDWGSLLNVGLERIYVTPAAALGPAAVIVLASVILNATGNIVATALARDTDGRPSQSPSPTEAVEPEAVGHAPITVAGAVLHVRELSVEFSGRHGRVTPVRNVSLTLRPGERLGIVGESGSGKSLTALAVADLIERPGEAHFAELRLSDADVRTLSARERWKLYGTSLATVFQDALGALNPVRRIGGQIVEAAETHLGMTGHEARSRAADRLKELGIAGAERRLDQYPHELSGGMSQRVTIAMGLMTEPDVIVADEPTTALDVTVQRQVLRALRAINRDHGTAVILISHDMSVIRAFCERVVVMYAGRIVEQFDVAGIDHVRHPYTRALLAAVPDMSTDRAQPLATIPGRPPAPDELLAGCAFAPRCAFAGTRCRVERPPLIGDDDGDGASVACWHPQEGRVRAVAESA